MIYGHEEVGWIQTINNEYERVKALIDYAILDTSTERSYDNITLLASHICDTPIAVVSLIDQGRQWFKSKIGLEMNETPRAISVCSYTIEIGDAIILPDLKEDERFANNPLVTRSPKIRFYAGAPLITPSGYSIGTLAVMDYKPRQIDETKVQDLKILAEQVVANLEIRKLNSTLKSQMAEVLKKSEIITRQQTQLIEAEKKASIGVMTSGIAHEINNPLNIVIGKAHQLHRWLGAQDSDLNKVTEGLAVIEKAAARIAKIITSMLALTRESNNQEPELKRVGSLIDDTLILCRQRFDSAAVELNVLPPPADFFINCHGTRLSQVLLNLLNNAYDAVEKQNYKFIRVKAEGNSESIYIKISDNGPGVPTAIRNRIMDPFFTTKDVGRGTGLGLSIAKTFVERHGGSLSLDESSSHLTTFVMKIPRAHPG
jgi:signal transduction histidine kinase